MVRRLITVIPSAAADAILKLPRLSQRLNQEGQNLMLDELINPKHNGIAEREEIEDFGRIYIFEKKRCAIPL